MTSAHSVFSLICLINIAQQNLLSSSSVHQERRLISTKVGENVTLQCFDERDDSCGYFCRLFWYRQPLGQEPQVISSYQTFDSKINFYNEFIDKKRFTLEDRKNFLTLNILDVQLSDTGIYYCAKTTNSIDMKFSEGTTVLVNQAGLSSETLVLQSDSETIHSGDSVSLTCTAYTESCEGEPSVYWFKNSEDHQPSLIYTQTDNNHQCERRNHTQTHTCFYNLSLTNLDQSKAGTYYCAVTVCGRVVFGNGTRLEFKDLMNSLGVVYVLTGALVFSTILLIFLTILTYRRIKSNGFQLTALPPSVTEDDNGSTEELVYATQIVTQRTRSQTQRQEECLYSIVKT